MLRKTTTSITTKPALHLFLQRASVQTRTTTVRNWHCRAYNSRSHETFVGFGCQVRPLSNVSDSHRFSSNKALIPSSSSSSFSLYHSLSSSTSSPLLSQSLLKKAFSTSLEAVPSITLYQYNICPFCNKAKVLLNYVGLDYEAVEVNPLTKAELKPW